MRRVAGDEATFVPGRPDASLDRLAAAAIEVFGRDEARTLFATLGPEDG